MTSIPGDTGVAQDGMRRVALDFDNADTAACWMVVHFSAMQVHMAEAVGIRYQVSWQRQGMVLPAGTVTSRPLMVKSYIAHTSLSSYLLTDEDRTEVTFSMQVPHLMHLLWSMVNGETQSTADGIGWAVACAEGATSAAGWVDLVAGHLAAGTGWAAFVNDVGDVFIPEVFHGGEDWVWRGLPECAEGGIFHRVANAFEFVNVFHLPRPSVIMFRISEIRRVPIRHGVQRPQDSSSEKCR